MNTKFKLIIVVIFLAFSSNSCKEKNIQKGEYYCPPCPSDCHNERYEKLGTCPTCDMRLIKKRTPDSFEGYKKQDVKITSGDIILNAAYYSPNNGTTTNTAVVIVHGSAPNTYDEVGLYTDMAARLGISVLAFDKRGCGESEGVYEYFTVEGSKEWFDLLALDVTSCLNWLKNQPEIDEHKIGLLGGSQAGWIMPLVASRNTTVNFIIAGEGPAISAGEEAFHSDLTGDGSGDGVSINEADEKLKLFDGVQGFDPKPILKNLNTKILWFFGTKDDVIPVNASIEVLNDMNNENHKIIVLPNGDHNFRNVETGKRYDLTIHIEPWLKQIGILEY